MRYCVDCKWCISPPLGSKFARCRHPKTQRPWTSKVDPKIENDAPYCNEERSMYAGWRSLWAFKCGKQGKLWEPK